ncbi:MAG: hypothetical protein IJ666_03950 [Ruminococcus sp.]|nr:hypothetical protein [Ruminococcus sp.]
MSEINITVNVNTGGTPQTYIIRSSTMSGFDTQFLGANNTASRNNVLSNCSTIIFTEMSTASAKRKIDGTDETEWDRIKACFGIPDKSSTEKTQINTTTHTYKFEYKDGNQTKERTVTIYFKDDMRNNGANGNKMFANKDAVRAYVTGLVFGTSTDINDIVIDKVTEILWDAAKRAGAPELENTAYPRPPMPVRSQSPLDSTPIDIMPVNLTPYEEERNISKKGREIMKKINS